VTGACLTIRRKLFDFVSGFDKIYGLGTFEDCDLCFKAKQLGQRVFVNVTALGYHYTGSTAEKKRVQFPIGQNRMIFQSKWAKFWPDGMDSIGYLCKWMFMFIRYGVKIKE